MALTVQSTYPSARTAAIAGTLADTSAHEIVAMVNNEASAEILFGQAVCFEGSTIYEGVLSPDITSDKICGIAIRAYNYVPSSDLGDTGVEPGGVLNVLRKGRCWVTVEEAVAPGDRMFIRVVTSGSETEGAFRKSADSSDCIDSTTQGVYLSTAGIGGVALLEVDFTNEA